MFNEEGLDWKSSIIAVGLAIGAIVEGIRVASGHTEDLRNYVVRGAFVLGCIVWAVVYVTLREERSFKTFFGGAEIVIALLLTWYQLTKLGETGWNKSDLVDRCPFLLGSIALLSKGMKDVFEDGDAKG